MREEKHYSTELLWYAGGLVQLAIVTLVWTYVENQAMPQRILLTALGAAIGGLALYAIGETIRPTAAPAPGEPAVTDNKPGGPVSVTSNNNIVSVGPGGVHIGTYVNQAPQPQLKLIDQKDIVEPDGSHTTTFTVEVVSQLTPSFLAIDIAAQGIKNVRIMPPPIGGVSAMMLRNVRWSSTDYHAELTSPRGRYEVTVQTTVQTPVKLSYQF